MRHKFNLRYILAVILLCSANIYAQEFKSGVLIGLSGSQITGDQMAGFDKGGFIGGIYVSYPFSKLWSGQFEMLFTMKGSKRTYDSLGNYTSGLWDNLELGYIEVPILAKYNISRILEVYAGPAPALLIYSTLYPDRRSGELKADFLRQYDLGLCGGISINFLPHWSFTVRYTNSIISIGTGKSNSIFSNSPVNNGLLNLVASGGIYFHFLPNKLTAHE